MSIYVVIHKNPRNTKTYGGKRWTADGLTMGWTELQCEAHVKRCEYADNGIEYKIIPIDEVEQFIPPLKKKRTRRKKQKNETPLS